MIRWTRCAIFIGATVVGGCAPQVDFTTEVAPTGDEPVVQITSAGGITLGDPIALAVGYEGNLFVADGSMARLVRISESGDEALEFQPPTQSSTFYPTDVELSGFFVYALDMAGRLVLRFDQTGAYRDVLISFDDALDGRRISPVGFDVDGSGRIAVTDAKNHVVLIFDSYLQIELVFGNYGTTPGRLDSPEGVSFTDDNGLLVCDTGNGRLQLFDSGGSYVRTIPPRGESPLQRPRRAVIDREGRFYVADPEAGQVFVFAADGTLLRRIAPAGNRRFRPMDVAITPSGMVFVADSATGSLYGFR